MTDISTLISLAAQIRQLYCSTCKEVCKKYSLSQSDFDVLEYLSSPCSGDTVSEISKDRLIKKANASTAADRLIKKGYLTRVPDEFDKRVIHLKLTKESGEAVCEVMRANEEFTRYFTEYLSESELEGFSLTVRKLINGPEKTAAAY